jgi:shikimate kinase / 3-dehydroquinate synthase
MEPQRRPILCLWGFMGTGKSTLGARVAAATGARLVDLDATIEAAAGTTIAALFASEGEAAFREREREAWLEALGGATPVVIALGGGALLDPRSRAEALAHAFVVVLEADVETIARRTAASERPLLAGDEAAIPRLLAARAVAYADAHLHLDTRDASVDALSEALVRAWNGAR